MQPNKTWLQEAARLAVSASSVEDHEPTRLAFIGQLTKILGEQAFLLVDDIGYLNLASFAYNEYQVDWSYLRDVVRVAVRALDNLAIKHEDTTSVLHLNVLGFADMLEVLKMRYIGEAGLQFASDLAYLIGRTSWEASGALALVRGVVEFQDKSYWDKFRMPNRPVRHHRITEVIPCAEAAELAGVTAGIEPAKPVHYLEKINMCATWQEYVDGEVVTQVYDLPSEQYSDAVSYAEEMGIKEIWNF